MTTAPALAERRRGSEAASVARRAALRGFTLMELMVVCAILGIVLLLVPPSLDGYGSRGRLEQGASFVAESITAARDQAIFDGHAVILEYDLENDRLRFHLSSRVRVSNAPDETGRAPDARAEPPPEPDEEWVVGEWSELPKDVDMSGYSEAKDAWERGKSQSIQVTFTPEGIVRPAHAVRVESRTLPKNVERTMTVRVNALTSLSEVVPGDAEMPQKRDASDFR